jgi:RHS repeat-associated protein
MKDEVVRVAAAETGYRVFGVGEYTSAGAWEKLYLSLNGHKFPEYSNNTTYFFHTDHLGTPRAQSNLSAGVVETWRAHPYGEQWQQSGGAGATHRYTGKERDAESANDYFGARYCGSTAASFLAVDPVSARPDDPQSLNRYAYARSGPVGNIDRDGRDWSCACMAALSWEVIPGPDCERLPDRRAASGGNLEVRAG